MKTTINLAGRILYLSDDPQIMQRQLQGEDCSLAQAEPLRDNISTDEITPVTVMLDYDERLGRFPYVGFKSADTLPIGVDQVRQGGFSVTVAGSRYGKGSSRESSPLAELSAGIRLIVARSFERIYQQNCDNLGILTTTDFGVLDRIAAGEPIYLEEFLEGRDALTQQIIRNGGLLRYSRSLDWSANDLAPALRTTGPKTLVEKIIERHLHVQSPAPEVGAGVFIRADLRFSHDYFTGMCAHLLHQAYGEPASLVDPQSIITFEDHLVLASESVPHIEQNLLPGIRHLVDGHERFSRRYPVRSHGADKQRGGSEGICHALMIERYALPGQVVIGTDSHTPHSGALGCMAFGVGASDMTHSWHTGHVRCKVPETLRIEVNGELAEGVMAKDLVLHLLRLDFIRQGKAIGCVFEYGGSAIRRMSVDERATLTNMVAELGGMTGIVEPDDKVVAFLRERRGVEVQLEPWMRSDPDAVYRDVLEIDASQVSVMLAAPGDPGNGVAISEMAGPVRVDIAYGGSCTAGKRSDFDAYHEVIQWAQANGIAPAPHTRFFLQFGTADVHDYCKDQGYLETFRQAGVQLIMPGCGACANCGPGQSTAADQVTVSAINRNFPGRSGPGSVWLASPYTVAASALAGSLTSFAQLQSRHAAAAG